jgi:tRNA A-37 threonylcarbamoyl transferase component Bud32
MHLSLHFTGKSVALPGMKPMIAAHGIVFCLVIYAWIFFSVPLYAQAPSPSNALSPGEEKRTGDRLRFTVQANVRRGKVFFYNENHRLVATCRTGEDTWLKSGNYRVVVIADDTFFARWKGENFFSPLDYRFEYELSPTQRHEIKWGNIVFLLGAGAVISLFLMKKDLLRGLLQKTRPAAMSGHAAVSGALSVSEEGAMPSVSAKQPGDTLPRMAGPYSILSRLGQGGMATVYKVRDNHGDIYALKVPHPHIFNIPEFKARFFREAEIIKSLHHPGIVRLYDYGGGEGDETPYICMEFVTGKSLRTFLEENQVLPVSYIARTISEIAGALGYAHSKGITHRDIKPDNIMITQKGQIKVMDLGIARAADQKTLTATGATLGTPHYIAPEQVEMKRIDGRADLYSLGVIMYQMLTARFPFDADEPIKIIIMHISDEPTPPSAYNRLIPADIEAIVMKMMSKNPDDRFQTAEELIAALKTFCC